VYIEGHRVGPVVAVPHELGRGEGEGIPGKGASCSADVLENRRDAVARRAPQLGIDVNEIPGSQSCGSAR
jgi:hypothetical protein